MKRPNGCGSVYKLSGKRRKPYAVAVTLGWNLDGTQIKKIIATAKTSSEAYSILEEYNQNPYNIDNAKITLIELYNKWFPWKFTETDSKSKNQTRYKNAIKYYEEILNKRFVDITLLDLQHIIDKCTHGYATKSDIKTLYSQLYDFARINNIPVKTIVLKYLNIGNKIQSTLHIPFSEEEIELLWSNSNDDFVKLILIDIYTGFRPKELLNPTEINLKQEYITAGCKTDAGIDRVVPIHKKIYQFVKDVLAHTKMSYVSYNRKFSNTMKKLNLNHTPYDCRHTFATRADNYGLNKLCIKKIMGHAISDITDGTYTHKTLDQLKEEINKLP